jgi:hypothetical protein
MTPKQLSHRVAGFRFHPDVDVEIPHPRHGTLAGGPLTWDDQGCQNCGADSCPNVSSQALKGVTAGSNVKGVYYRTVGRMALSAMKRNKVMYTS